MSVNRLWNPWAKPEHGNYKAPTDIQGSNAKLDSKKVAMQRRLNEIKENMNNKSKQKWDALA